MIIEDGLSIKTTSSCNRRCKNCSVVPWMDAHPGYQMDMQDIVDLVKMSSDNNIQWKYILLSGGEPLLWNKIVEGAGYLYRSGITKDLKLLTNAIAVSKDTLNMIEKLLSVVHHFRVSRYNNNGAQIQLLRNRFGSRIEIEDRTIHMVPPKEPIENSLPADCRCRAYAMVDGRICSCGPARTITLYKTQTPLAGWTYGMIDYECYIRDFVRYFIEDSDRIDRFNIPECRYCIANAKVQKHLLSEEA